MAIDGQKLTKKQKKASAFRERKGKNKAGEDETLDVPVAEDQDAAEAETAEPVDPAPPVKKAKGVEKEKKQKDGDEKSAKPAKRKREQGEENAGEAQEGQKKKRRKKAKGGEQSAEGEQDAGDEKPQRLILFVGNLKYTTSREAIQTHFAACDPPPSIRLLTPKPTRPGATVAKSKGCAFLEFTVKSALQQALKLHQSEIEGRRINVELTAGGGGKSENRLTKLKGRNKELNTQRSKKAEKTKALGEVPPSRPQRFSTTSGEGDAPQTKRTWTVGDTVEEETHRGGKRVRQARKPRVKDYGTGVNSIPVG
ncbi:hypothetical protein OF83DRAFT_1167828 [Amylostereum chailletii]|nr:hypothetical protein OF83DRAFT_1167828 [Amylostereum chailletii]